MLDDLAYCVEYLLNERFDSDEAAQKRKLAGLSEAGHPAVCRDAQEKLFSAYRDLVNTREPLPASDTFLAAQDRMLQAQIDQAGITYASDLPRTPKDERLSLWRGDITTLAIDAIVNAANSQLLGCWIPGHFCIDNAIHTYAGIQLRAECARIMDEQGYPEPTGMAKVTPAYNLPAKWIIHTVGPIASGHPSKVDVSLLADCYKSCLAAAADAGAKDIAFCCISTGVFGFPKMEAAEIAVRTVRAWLDAEQPDMHVVFNVYGKDDEKIYHELLYTTSVSPTKTANSG